MAANVAFGEASTCVGQPGYGHQIQFNIGATTIPLGEPAAEPAKNLLKNPSFEQQLDAWTIGNGYTMRVDYHADWTVNGGVKGSGALEIGAGIPPDDGYIYDAVVKW